MNQINTIYSFLKELNIFADKYLIQDELNKHLFEDSIMAIHDTLVKFGVNNMVCKIAYNQLKEIPLPSLIPVKIKNRTYFMILLSLSQDVNMVSLKNKSKFNLKICELCKIWDGTILIAERKESMTCFSNRTMMFLKSLLFWMENHYRFMVTIILSAIALIACFFQYSHQYSMLIFLILDIAGIFMSLAAFKNSLSNDSDGICMYGKCSDVIKEKRTYLLGRIPLGILSLSYFISMFLIDLSGSTLVLKLMISGVTLLAVLYSAIWQILHKSFCIICTSIDIILALYFILSLMQISPYSESQPMSEIVCQFIEFSGFFMIISVGMLLVLEFSNKAGKYIEMKKRLGEFIINEENFNHLLSLQPSLQYKEVSKTGLSNNHSEKSSVNLFIVINPVCDYCGRMTDTIKNLRNCNIDIIFLIDNKNEQSVLAAATFLHYGRNVSFEKVLDIISEWYKSKTLPSYELQNEDYEILNKQRSFCLGNGLIATPCIYVNSHKLPSIYRLEDLEYLYS